MKLPVFALIVSVAGCTSAPVATPTEATPTRPTPPTRAPEPGDLVITQLYTSGAVPTGAAERYYSDQFIELGNNSEAALDLSGIRVADVYGVAGAINPGTQPDSFRESRPNRVVMSTVWRLPDGLRLEPGETMVIAHDGTNHRPFSTVDLSDAAVEAFVEASGRDEDYPTVPNLESVEYNAGFDWLMTVFGPSVVVFDADTPMTEAPGGWPSLPVTAVFDGVDTVMDADSAAFKRLPDAVDAGFGFVDGPYTGVALHRRRMADGRWQDTNDTSADFESAPPEPTRAVAPEAPVGDGRLTLGTGTTSYVPLEVGDSVELVAGPQGGWHLDVSVAFEGFGPAGVELTYDAVDAMGGSISYVTTAQLFDVNVLEADSGWHRTGDRVVLDIGGASEVVDTSVVLRVSASVGDETWSDERQVVIVDDE